MVTATIVVFLAIFGGMAILGLMIWLISRRNRGNSSSNNFIGDSSRTNYQNDEIVHDDSDDFEAVNQNYYAETENQTSEQTAYAAAEASATYESSSNQNDYSPPAADYSSGDSSSSSYDSGSSSYDSGGSSDSGSSSSSSD